MSASGLHISYMRKKRLPAISILWFSCAVSLSACHHGSALERRDSPERNAIIDVYSDGRAMLRSLYCEISVRQIGEAEWESLLKNSMFINAAHHESAYRVPRLNFFVITVKNTGELPLVMEEISLSFGSEKQALLTPAAIRKGFASPMYGLFNFDEIMGSRRLLVEEYDIKKLDFAEDTVNYKLDFIAPDDTLIRIVAFGYPPVSVRKYRMDFSLKYQGALKRISFTMTRNEYRTRGQDFIERPDNIQELMQ
jgi:hypothetical protein